MNLHASAHFPIVPVVAAVIGAAAYAFAKDPVKEMGRALLWTGALVALLQSS